jgi:hypothetical protein
MTKKKEDNEKERKIVFAKLGKDKPSIVAGNSMEDIEAFRDRAYKNLQLEEVDRADLPRSCAGEVKRATEALEKSQSGTYMLVNTEHDSENDMVKYLFNNSFVIGWSGHQVEVMVDKSAHLSLRPEYSLTTKLSREKPNVTINRREDFLRGDTIKYGNRCMDKGLEAYVRRETEIFDGVVFVDYDSKRLAGLSRIEGVTVINPDVFGEDKTIDYIVSLFSQSLDNAIFNGTLPHMFD